MCRKMPYFNEEKYQFFKKEREYCDELCRYLSTGINDLFDSMFDIDYLKDGIQEWKCPFCSKKHTIELETIEPNTEIHNNLIAQFK